MQNTNNAPTLTAVMPLAGVEDLQQTLNFANLLAASDAADADGTVKRAFLGPVTATDLWAAMAEEREPGSVPPDCHGDLGHVHADGDAEPDQLN